MLTTTAAHDIDLDRAIGELMGNASLLAAAGLAREAHEALALLQQEGPWRLPAHGTLMLRLQRLLPGVCLLAGQPCPRLGEQAAMSGEELAAWAAQQAQEGLRSLARVGRQQAQPAGANWSPAFLATLAERCDPSDSRPHLAFGAFCIDAEFVLQARVAHRFGCSTALMDLPSADELATLGLPPDELANLLAQLPDTAPIDIAAPAAATATLDIVRAIDGYLQATGPGGYLEPLFLSSWLLLVDEGADIAAEEAAAIWLRHGEQVCARMLDFAALPSVNRSLRKGGLAAQLRVDARAAREWLERLRMRPARSAPKPGSVSPPVSALMTAQALQASLQGTELAGLAWQQVPVPDSGEWAWVAAVPVTDRKQLWHEARALVDRTGQWPLITTLWSSAEHPPPVDQLSDELFMRWPYGQGPARDDILPSAFIAASRAVDVNAFLAGLAQHEALLDDDSQHEVWRFELERRGLVLEGYDAAWAACGGDRLRFERWLAEHEAAHGVADPELGRQPPFDPGNAWLVLLPTPHGEDALAYLHWYGLERGSVEGFIGLLRSWRERHAAELWAHYGTMLEFVVRQPPADLDTALRLAREHELAAPCTLQLPGTALRHHALGLIDGQDWFLHERP